MVRSSTIERFLSIFLNIFLNDPDFLLRKVVEVIDQLIDLPVGGVDLALEVRLFVVRPGGGQPPVEGLIWFVRVSPLSPSRTLRRSESFVTSTAWGSMSTP